jgi:hypothetical protein
MVAVHKDGRWIEGLPSLVLVLIVGSRVFLNFIIREQERASGRRRHS